MFQENRTHTLDANNNKIIAGSIVICIDDSLGGDCDTPDDWNFVKGQKYTVDHIFDSENLIHPMVVLKGSKNGPVMANRFLSCGVETHVLENCDGDCLITLDVEFIADLPYETITLKNSDGSTISLARYEFESAYKALNNIRVKSDK